MTRRILVTGGRDNFDYITIHKAVKEHCQEGDTLVHGDAAGVDRIAAQAARYLGLAVEAHSAAWKVNGVYNPKAGPERNQRMIESGIDLALIFAGGKGTADMTSRIIKAKIDFWDYQFHYKGEGQLGL